jgi:hypothetical protein
MKAMRDEDDADDEGFEWMLWGEEGDVTAIKIPDPAADGSVLGLHNQPAFVEFLREAFAWGGFPGWQRTSQRPQKELDYLREGLLPL